MKLKEMQAFIPGWNEIDQKIADLAMSYINKISKP